MSETPAATTPPPHETVWLRAHGQSLGLVPTLGGAVAAWRLDRAGAPLDLWRSWDGETTDLYRLASFAMLPWSNRIAGGGFEQDGRFHPMRPNRAGEPYPIHGDGWLQPWTLDRIDDATVEMHLESHGFDGNPYHYAAVQRFRLFDGGLEQSVTVRQLGGEPLPFGLGLHPWFPRPPGTRVVAPIAGVWLCGADPIPTTHTTELPADWDLSRGIPAEGGLIDNAYTGWRGSARIEWPSEALGVSLERLAPDGTLDDREGWCLVYRPPVGPAFCFEPITQPIDAFHLEGRPGLRVLAKGESLSLAVRWRVGSLAAA